MQEIKFNGKEQKHIINNLMFCFYVKNTII